MAKKKPVFIWVSIAVFVVAVFLILSQNLQENLNLPGFSLFGEQEEGLQVEYSIKQPVEIVRQYFESWDKEDWPNMYATLSDGFKRIDQNAKDLASFRDYASSQGIEGVKVIDAKEKSKDDYTAIVSYSVEFAMNDGSKKNFSDEFTLKFRPGDVIRGWKLIHPYGSNIDTS